MKNGSAKLPFAFGEIFLLTTLRPLATTSSVTCSPGANPGTWPLATILSVTPGRFGPSRARVGGPVAALAETAGKRKAAPTAAAASGRRRNTGGILDSCAASIRWEALRDQLLPQRPDRDREEDRADDREPGRVPDDRPELRPGRQPPGDLD